EVPRAAVPDTRREIPHERLVLLRLDVRTEGADVSREDEHLDSMSHRNRRGSEHHDGAALHLGRVADRFSAGPNRSPMNGCYDNVSRRSGALMSSITPTSNGRLAMKALLLTICMLIPFGTVLGSCGDGFDWCTESKEEGLIPVTGTLFVTYTGSRA